MIHEAETASPKASVGLSGKASRLLKGPRDEAAQLEDRE